MKKDTCIKKYFIPFFILCLSLLMPLPWNCNSAQAASVSTSSSTEDKQQSDVKLNVKKKKLVKGTSYSLVLYNLDESYKASFKSSDSDIVSVDKDGNIKAEDKGDATVTITIKNGSKTIQTLSCDITVGMPAVDIKFNKDSGITLVVGKSSLLETTIQPSGTVEEAVFKSSDTSIATVSSNGRVTAKSAGTTYIFAQLNNGKYASIQVTVVEDAPTASPTAQPEKNKDTK